MSATNFYAMSVRRMLIWETTNPIPPASIAGVDWFVLMPWDAANLATIRAAEIRESNVKAKVLAYQDVAAMKASSQNGLFATGIGLPNAEPGWQLLDANGQPITYVDFPNLFAADIGNPDYQRTWADNVLTLTSEQGFDGVFADDTNPAIGHGISPASVVLYPSDVRYGAAMTSFVEMAFPLLREAGKLVVANIASSWIPTYNAVATPWLAYMDGALNEFYWQIPPP